MASKYLRALALILIGSIVLASAMGEGAALWTEAEVVSEPFEEEVPEAAAFALGDEAGDSQTEEAPLPGKVSHLGEDPSPDPGDAADTGSLRIVLSVTGGEAADAGVCAFSVEGPDGYASIAVIAVENGVGAAQIDGLPFGVYTVSEHRDGADGVAPRFTGDGTAEVTAAHTPDAPAEVRFALVQDEAPALAAQSAATERTIGVGQSFAIDPSALFGRGATAFLFASSSKKIATVSASGVVKGVKAGTATIGIAANTGEKVTLKVTVKKAPTSVKLSAKKGTLGVGQQYRLTASLSPKGCLPGVEFKSSDASVVAVDADGLLTAVGVGTATVTAQAWNKKKATCKVTVKARPEALALNQKAADVCVKGTLTLKPSVSPSGALATCAYATSNAAVATVSGSGKITGKKAGTATITVTSWNGIVATCAVTVWPAPTGVALSQKTATLGVGQTLALQSAVKPADANPKVTWSTSNAKVASVADGVVTARKAGTATITAKTANGKKAKCKVTVKAAPKSVTVKAAKTALAVGETTKATVTLTKNSFSPIEWYVEGDAVTVDQSGNITAVKAGTANVVAWATATAGTAGSCTITVAETAVNEKGLIIDISKWQGSIDFDKLKPCVSLVIARASCSLDIDSKFSSYAASMKSRGIPFGVYCYSHASTEAIARAEARKLVEYAAKYGPKFYVIDAEAAEITQAAIAAFADELRAQGVKKVGAYVGHHMYAQYGFSAVKGLFDFVWIPRYGKNDGTVANATLPSYPCDLWQYTSSGTVPGITGRVDVSVVTGQGKSLKWFVS